MPRATKKVSPATADAAPVETAKVRKGKRPAEDAPEEGTVPPKAPRTVLAKSKQPTAVNGEATSLAKTVESTTSKKAVKSKKTVASSSTKAVEGFTLHCFGTNDCGQLGFQCEKRKFPALVPSLQNQKFVSVACGGMHTLALEANGTLWSFGVNDEKALGRPTEEEEDGFEPGKIEIGSDTKIVQISAGDSHSAALTEDGVVYIWGCFKDDNGNFGLIPDGGEICRQKPEMITSHLNVKIKKIASGAHHLAMLGEDGHLYTCGTGTQGQLGRENDVPKRVTRSNPAADNAEASKENEKKFLLTPTLVKFGRNPKISDIWTGEFSTYCKSEKGNDIYACGLNNYAQLGIKRTNDKKNIIPKPTKNTSFKGKVWKQIAAGQHHAVGLDEEGKVYTLGRNIDGRLGLGPENREIEMYDEPQLVEGLADKICVHVASGGSTSYAITSEGHLYSWGFGENYQLATGDDEDRNVPTRCLKKPNTDIDGKVVSVHAGGQHVGLTIALPTDINGNT